MYIYLLKKIGSSSFCSEPPTDSCDPSSSSPSSFPLAKLKVLSSSRLPNATVHWFQRSTSIKTEWTWRSSTTSSAQPRQRGTSRGRSRSTPLGQRRTAEPWFLNHTIHTSFRKQSRHTDIAETERHALTGFRVSARTDVHRRRHGELHHEHVAVQRVTGQQPEPVGGVDDGDADQREEHEADAQDCDDHPTLQPRLPKPCTHVQSSFRTTETEHGWPGGHAGSPLCLVKIAPTLSQVST